MSKLIYYLLFDFKKLNIKNKKHI